MGKAIIGIGHNEYILDISDAVTVAEIMAKAENFKVKHDYTVTPTTVAYFIWEQEVTLSRNHVTIHLLPDAVYRVAKLAGKPQD